MVRLFTTISVLLVSMITLLPVLAEESGATIQIEKPWARASIIQSRPAAAYLTVVNRGDKPDRLVSVSSPIAETVSIHLTEMTNGVMQMSPMHDLPLDAGANVTLGPGGLHLMLMNLRAPLRKGDMLPLTLNFELAGKIEVQAQILGPGAKGPE